MDAFKMALWRRRPGSGFVYHTDCEYIGTCSLEVA